MNCSEKIITKELMRETEQYLLRKGYKQSTLVVYNATWNRFLLFSKSDYYDRRQAEEFLLRYFGVDVNQPTQKLDMQMRHALRHMNSLEEFASTGEICRRKMRRATRPQTKEFNLFFSEYLDYRRMCNHTECSIKVATFSLKQFLFAIQAAGVDRPENINLETIELYSAMMSNEEYGSLNTRRMRIKDVGVYLNWLYQRKITEKDFSMLLPNIKRQPPQIPTIWSESDIEKILSVIDTSNSVGKRNYAIFLILARTGLRISDVVSLKFQNIDWKRNMIQLSQQKTGEMLSIPLSKEIGLAIISYMKYGRPNSDSPYLFLSHTAPFQPMNYHNNFHYEMKKYIRRAGITIPQNRHTGVHSIRHSFATNLLKNGTSLENISQILGHSDINVTETYLRVDIDNLRLCALTLEDIQ